MHGLRRSFRRRKGNIVNGLIATNSIPAQSDMQCIDGGNPDRRLHVSVVDEELPYPANSGKRIRTLNLLTRLARQHRVVLITHRNLDAAEVAPAIEYLKAQGIEPVVVDRGSPPRSVQSMGPRFYAGLAANLLSARPYVVDVNYSPALREAVRSHDREHRVDLWQSEWTPYAEVLRDIDPGRKLIMAHNIESLIWRRYYTTESNPLKRWYIKLQHDKFVNYERRAFEAARMVVTVSKVDEARARETFATQRLAVVENGVDTRYFQPGTTERAHGQLLFLGSLDWRPNLDAVEQLLSVIFPTVLAQQPSAQLCIVGRNPPESLRQRVAATPCVELHADVADVRPFLARADLMLVPLRIGGGSRLKILEALAMKTPVLSTSVGAEGLEVQNGQHLVLIESCGEMAQSILHHAQARGKASVMADQGRTLVENCYEWDILADRLGQIWNDVVSSARSKRLRA
jgi:glycosyltransferase involved in cell wall biosynthesis